MSQKSRTSTTYKNGKPVAAEKSVSIFGRVRTAIAGDERLLDEMMAHSDAAQHAEFACAAFLARAS